MANFAVERLDHLGIMAGVCQEMGLVEYFDGLDERVHARVTLGQGGTGDGPQWAGIQ